VHTGRTLDRQLTNWLANVPSSEEYAPPVKGCKAIIAPYVPPYSSRRRVYSLTFRPSQACGVFVLRSRSGLGLQVDRYDWNVSAAVINQTEVDGRLICQSSRSKRVFILGPAHHVYLTGCALSKFKAYDTPLGELTLDLESMCPWCYSRDVNSSTLHIMSLSWTKISPPNWSWLL
jgi:hypothetical protein